MSQGYCRGLIGFRVYCSVEGLPAILAEEGPGWARVPSLGSLGPWIDTLEAERRCSDAGRRGSSGPRGDGCMVIMPDPRRVMISPDRVVVSLAANRETQF